jgi:hypothetical protein
MGQKSTSIIFAGFGNEPLGRSFRRLAQRPAKDNNSPGAGMKKSLAVFCRLPALNIGIDHVHDFDPKSS